MPPETKKVLVFDLDGTLVDSMGDFADLAARIVSRVYGIEEKEARQCYLNTSGLPFRGQLESLFPGDPRNEETAGEFEERKKIGYFEKNLHPHLEELLHHLREKGIKCAVSSNNMQELVEEFLKEKGITFDMVLGWRPNFAKGKDHFRHIRKSLRTSSSGILFVGDSLKDAECAAEESIEFVGKAGTFPESAFREKFPQFPVIHNLTELKELL